MKFWRKFPPSFSRKISAFICVKISVRFKMFFYENLRAFVSLFEKHLLPVFNFESFSEIHKILFRIGLLGKAMEIHHFVFLFFNLLPSIYLMYLSFLPHAYLCQLAVGKRPPSPIRAGKRVAKGFYNNWNVVNAYFHSKYPIISKFC